MSASDSTPMVENGQPMEPTVENFVREHPEWADLPPEAIKRSFTYATWAFSVALRSFGEAVTTEVRKVLRR